MTKTDIIDRIQTSTGNILKESYALLEATLEIIKETLESGEEVKIKNSKLLNADFSGVDLSRSIFYRQSVYNNALNTVVDTDISLKCSDLRKAGAIFNASTICED